MFKSIEVITPATGHCIWFAVDGDIEPVRGKSLARVPLAFLDDNDDSLLTYLTDEGKEFIYAVKQAAANGQGQIEEIFFCTAPNGVHIAAFYSPGTSPTSAYKTMRAGFDAWSSGEKYKISYTSQLPSPRELAGIH